MDNSDLLHHIPPPFTPFSAWLTASTSMATGLNSTFTQLALDQQHRTDRTSDSYMSTRMAHLRNSRPDRRPSTQRETHRANPAIKRQLIVRDTRALAAAERPALPTDRHRDGQRRGMRRNRQDRHDISGAVGRGRAAVLAPAGSWPTSAARRETGADGAMGSGGVTSIPGAPRGRRAVPGDGAVCVPGIHVQRAGFEGGDEER